MLDKLFEMKKIISILLSLALSLTLSARDKKDYEHLSFSKEFDILDASADSLFRMCQQINLYHLNPEDFVFPICYVDSHLLRFSYAWHRFEYNKEKYELCYKVFLSCFEEKIIVELGFVQAYRMNSYDALGSVIHQTDYMTADGSGVPWWTRKHDKAVREQILPTFFEDLCTKIKAELIILRNR